MTHLKDRVREELKTLNASFLEEWSGNLAGMVADSLIYVSTHEGSHYENGVLHNLLDELWTLVIEEQRRRKEELMAETQRFVI